MHKKQLVFVGEKIESASAVLIMLHGRGADARDILGLAAHFNLKNFAMVAPEATNHTWYPYSFMAPVSENEPWLSSALALLDELVNEIEAKGFDSLHIYFLGFSQGACLTLEYVTRHAKRYGGVIAFTGGLIGHEVDMDNYSGNFSGTPVFIGSSDPDPHVPVARVHASAVILEKMGAVVTKKIYPNMGHTINQDEIDTVNELIFSTESG
jgi:phospholipase/carboxylesterase